MVVCESFINPLDLECIFINTFAGSPIVFVGLAILAIAGLGAMFRMKNSMVLAMFGIFVVLFSPILGAELGGIYVVVAVVLVLILGKVLADLIKR